MSYRTGEQAIATLLEGVTGFSPLIITRSKWGILNTGKSDHYAILKPGPASSKWTSLRVEETTWGTTIQVWQRFRKDGSDVDALEDYANAITGRIEQYPHLGLGGDSAVVLSCVNKVSEILEMWAKAGGPQWIRMDLLVEWKEWTQYTFLE